MKTNYGDIIPIQVHTQLKHEDITAMIIYITCLSAHIYIERRRETDGVESQSNLFIFMCLKNEVIANVSHSILLNIVKY